MIDLTSTTDRTRRVVTGVRDDQLDLPTPLDGPAGCGGLGSGAVAECAVDWLHRVRRIYHAVLKTPCG